MSKKNIIAIVPLLIIGISLIIVMPIQVLFFRLSSYGIIDNPDPFFYTPSSPSTVEMLYLNIERGDVEIRYAEPPVDFYARIEVFIDMMGANLAGKSYQDFFDIIWQNNASPVSFTMRLKSNVDDSEVLPLIQDIKIVVILRADVIFGISAVVDCGDIDLITQYMVTIKSVDANTSDGDIFYDMNHCILQGDLSANADNGDTKLLVKNIQCTQNMIWNFTAQNGEMVVGIYQNNDIGFNITGSATIRALNLTYIDKNANIGALFTFPLSQWPPGGVGQTVIEFNVSFLPPGPGFYLTSTDFPGENNFELLFNIYDHERNFDIVVINNDY